MSFDRYYKHDDINMTVTGVVINISVEPYIDRLCPTQAFFALLMDPCCALLAWLPLLSHYSSWNADGALFHPFCIRFLLFHASCGGTVVGADQEIGIRTL